ncbi:MAG: hypothetical protein R3B95_14125 [Nitrospirales bacterium]|nr:hypothetical protein [Nitrospirales bacterium]
MEPLGHQHPGLVYKNGWHGHRLVFKASHQLVLYRNGKPLRRFSIELGFQDLGQVAGRRWRSTEGTVSHPAEERTGICKFHKPSYSTIQPATSSTLPRSQSYGTFGALRGIGDLIEIHGQLLNGNSTTNGCIACIMQIWMPSFISLKKGLQ